MMKYLIFLTLFVSTAQADYNKDRLYSLLSQKSHPSWFACKVNDECKHLIGPCNIAFPFNKKFERDIVKFLESLTVRQKQCIDYVGVRWPDNSLCLKEKCELHFSDKRMK